MISNTCILAIDMGATTTKYGLADHEGNILARGRISTTGHASAEALIDELHADVEKTRESLPGLPEIAAVGVGAPCANSITGEIEGATNMPWSHIPLGKLLGRKFGVRVCVANDANIAAAGERMFGVARGLDNFIMLTLGTGVGGGVYCDGHLLNGSRGFAAELGHIPVVGRSERKCACGQSGCLQTYCSASGVVETAVQFLGFTKSPSSLRDIPADKMTSKDIYDAAKEGDRIARDVFSFTGEILGKACASYLAFTDPDAIVLFGGVARASDFILPAMRHALDAYCLNIYKGRVKILVSTLSDDDAALLGAAALTF